MADRHVSGTAAQARPRPCLAALRPARGMPADLRVAGAVGASRSGRGAQGVAKESRAPLPDSAPGLVALPLGLVVLPLGLVVLYPGEILASLSGTPVLEKILERYVAKE
jgi:hypothetical protein